LKEKATFILFMLLVLFAALSLISAQNKFYLDLTNRSDDLFEVILIPEKLSADNNVYNFASTAPGTYQKMDIGRYVKEFSVYDKLGNMISSKQISINRWEISQPEIATKIIYKIAETWDTKVEGDQFFPMCGTSIENDHVVINGNAVFGFFDGMQKEPIYIKLVYPTEWISGTSLKLNSEGYYIADNYDMVVDSPIMLGSLSKSSVKIEDTNIFIYTYSKNGHVNSDNLLILLEDILIATSQFTQGLPVDNYTFLFHFENFSAGAWEHNYSSFYVFADNPLDEHYSNEIRSIAAHEFFHIITPLNIHSEVVANFDYVKPTMSDHLWFYEGVTEWASDILQLRDYIIDIDRFLVELKNKLIANDYFDQSISLVDLARTSLDNQRQYGNIYMKGALVAFLLDIRILELSNGKYGLREVINNLYKDYGSNKPFSEKNFFNEFTERTFPEIGDFIERYIKGSEKLPMKEYLEKIGIDYEEYSGTDSSKSTIGMRIGVSEGKIVVVQLDNPEQEEIRINDIITKFEGEPLNLENAQSKAGIISKLKIGEKINLTVKRKGDEIDLKIAAKPRTIKHVMKFLDDANEKCIALRSAWMKNL
jgi:predicted metalloprotease with PDZ domain